MSESLRLETASERYRKGLIKEAIDENLWDEVNACIGDIDSFFDILITAELDGVGMDIAYTGHALVEDAYRRIEKLCRFIKQEFGEIKIVKECTRSVTHKGEMLGVTFTPAIREATTRQAANEQPYPFPEGISREG